MGKFLALMTTLVIVASVTTSIDAQKKSTVPPPPAEAEYNFTAVILPGQGVSMVSVEPNLHSPETLGETSQEFFKDFFGTRPRDSKRAMPKVTIRFADDDDIDAIVKAVNSVRVSPKIVVELQHLISMETLIVSPKPGGADSINVRPNPLFLMVAVDERGIVTLNNDATGKMSDLRQLSDQLKQIFSDREKNGVWRENTNEVDKTVFIKMPLKAPAAELIKIVKALRAAGSDRIGLQLDDLVPVRMVTIDSIPLTPPKRPTE
ncbi:MAG: hypothetical protein JO053_11580 [Acidobacteria bacterium]|nr:hypothetical protein [Acidobacteriota bacterium]